MNPYVGVSQSQGPTINLLGFPIDLASLLIFVGVIVLIFLAIRELVCWYWKINEYLEVMHGIKEEFSKLNALMETMIRNQEADHFTAQADAENITEPEDPRKE